MNRKTWTALLVVMMMLFIVPAVAMAADADCPIDHGTWATKCYVCAQNGVEGSTEGNLSITTPPIEGVTAIVVEVNCNIVEEATCTTNEYWSHTCANCGTELKARFAKSGTALGHDYQVISTLKKADCANGVVGIDKLFCLRCEETTYVSNEGHKYEEKLIEATCENPQMIAEVCTLCGDIGEIDEEFEGEPQVACGSEFVWVTESEDNEDYKAPTCTEAGYGHKVCAYCGKAVEGSEGEIAALGHETEDTGVYAAPTCTTGEGTVWACIRCDYEEIVEFEGEDYEGPLTEDGKHVEIPVEDIDPSCSATGWAGKTECEVCGEIINEGYEVDKDENVHNFVPVQMLKPVDCSTETDGVAKMACADCGASDGYKVINWEDSHDWEDEIIEEATCTEAGSMNQTCTICGAVVEDIKIEKIDHDFVEDFVDATCDEPAMYGVMCSVCGEPETELTVVEGSEPLGHKYVETVVEATCKSGAGVHKYCPVCEDEYVEEFVGDMKDPQKDHVTEIVGAIAANCTEAGYTGDEVCTVCGETIAEGEEIDPIDGEHVPGNVATLKAADCKAETDGVAKQACTKCEEALGYVVVKWNTTHDWEDEIIEEATCTEVGIMNQTCTICGTVVEDVKIEMIDHDFVEDFVDATCDEPAMYGVMCSVCGEAETELTVVEGSEALGHKYVETVVEATCMSGAGVHKYCPVCEDEYVDEFEGEMADPKKDHTVEFVGVVAPTCSEVGYTGDQVCSVCGELLAEGAEDPIDEDAHKLEKTDVLKPADCVAKTTGVAKQNCVYCGNVSSYVVITVDEAHDWADDIVKEATCVEAGEKNQTCTICGEVKNEVVIPATGEHSWVEDIIPETCTTDAKVGKFCSVCLLEDETEVVEDSALGHDWSDWAHVDASCFTAAGAERSCSRCDVTEFEAYTGDLAAEKLAHVEKTIEAIPATCETSGWTEGKECKVCGTVTVEPEEIDPVDNAHVWVEGEIMKDFTCTTNGIAKRVCSECGEQSGYMTVNAKHIYEDTIVVEPTCGEKGEKTQVCSVCGDTQEEVEIPATGEHNFIENYVDATCTEPAMFGQVCTECGATDGDMTVVSGSVALGHAEIPVEDKAATCQEAGYENRLACERCGEIITDNNLEVILPIDTENGHDYEQTVMTEATCSKAGIAKYTCSLCGDYYYGSYTLEHDWTPEMSNAAGTCVFKACNACGLVEIIETFEGYEEAPDCSYTGYHTPVTVTGYAATCDADGLTDGERCSVCWFEITAQETIPALGHTDGEVVVENEVEATCEVAGSYDNVIYCTVCGEETSRETVEGELADHSYDEGVEAEGVITYTCTVCGDSYTEDAHEHAYEAVVTEPTCTEAGYTTYTCECGDTYTADEVAALNHTAEEIPAVEATCTATGLTAGEKCSVCGEILTAQEEVAALDHTEEIVAGKAPNCTETGLTDGSVCTVCGETVVAQEEIPALGHTEETVAGKAATCTEAGLSDGAVCTVCGVTTAAQVEVPALGHTEVTDAGVAATCGTAGKTAGSHCSVCNTVLVAQEEIAPTGKHAFSVSYTYSDDGATEYVNYTCKNCGHTDVEEHPWP